MVRRGQSWIGRADMSDLKSELLLSLEVLTRWETLAALAVFLAAWYLFRYVALIRRKPKILRLHRMRRAAPPPESRGTPPVEEESVDNLEE